MTIEWFVPLGQTRPITMALQSLAADTRTTRGCVGCSVLDRHRKAGYRAVHRGMADRG